MSDYRWERERAAWLLAHSKPGGSLRRRAEILARAARRGSRAGAGLATPAAQDEITPSTWLRLTRDSSGERHHRVRYGLLAGLLALLIGPGWLLGCAAYRFALLPLSSRIGRLWWWPWAVAAGIALVARWLLTDWPLLVVSLGAGRYFPADFISIGAFPLAYVTWQLTVALVVVAVEIVVWGWMGVSKGAVPKSERNKDGSFRATPDKEKYQLDFDDDEVVAAAPAAADAEDDFDDLDDDDDTEIVALDPDAEDDFDEIDADEALEDER